MELIQLELALFPLVQRKIIDKTIGRKLILILQWGDKQFLGIEKKGQVSSKKRQRYGDIQDFYIALRVLGISQHLKDSEDVLSKRSIVVVEQSLQSQMIESITGNLIVYAPSKMV
ncbi:unnamed protein product [Paramecium pentaurelia]|uniref:Uncharacterized protein n=1 Tax=Paramecium pentaurelia TaxID=43138 RepID=A0A8S1VPI7_9CILI|nr:unnamed protein product [Paramecium pentaurelia]